MITLVFASIPSRPGRVLCGFLEGTLVHRYLIIVLAAMWIAGPAAAIIYENGMDNTLDMDLGTEDVTVRNNLDTGDPTTLEELRALGYGD